MHRTYPGKVVAVRRVCVYAGSNPGSDPAYADAARALASVLAERGIGLVYGGGNVGLMGVLADTALAAGGEVIGVMPQALVDREIGHRGLTELRVVGSMHERKALMAELSDAFVAVPGGIGTLEELIEVYTWSQLGIHDKPCGVLNVRGYYDALAAFLDHAVEEGFLRPQHRAVLSVAADPAELLDRLAAFEPPRSASGWSSIRPDPASARGRGPSGAAADHSRRRRSRAWWDDGAAVGRRRTRRSSTIVIGGRVAGLIQYGEELDAEVPPREHRHLRRPGAARPRHRHARRSSCSSRHLIEDRGHHRITIDPAADNAAAIRCYEKAGFTPVGVMRRYERDMATGEWHDGLLMELRRGRRRPEASAGALAFGDATESA